ncbi:MAG TPA: cytochrome c [Burkholderiales bacterium]|nr:cytochrome c [Burkholderiales bacterium]
MKKLVTVAVAGTLLLGAAHAFAAGDAAAGKQKSTTCAACHGADGNSVAPDFPRLAGQQPDYIVHSLNAYKSGARKDPIMDAMAANLSEQDIQDLAAYFSSQKGLYVKY